MSLHPSLNDPEALDFKRHPRTGTGRDREIEVTGERVGKGEGGPQPRTPSLTPWEDTGGNDLPRAARADSPEAGKRLCSSGSGSGAPTQGSSD